ncbi:MAG TPA: hypothetical protein VM901_09955 [Bdellovibrionota bacterium]|jgi:hypothetical protein|nr:hypothetical protein [Bdellovibrionota bacterium]
MKITKSRKLGMSLVMVMVAAAIMGLLSVVFAKLITEGQRGRQGVQQGVDFDILKSTVHMIIKDPELCALAFRTDPDVGVARFHPTVAIPAANQFKVLKMGTVDILKDGMNLGSGLVLQNLTLNATPGVPPIVAGTRLRHSVQLNFRATKTGGGYGPQGLTLPIPFSLLLETDATTHQILACGIETPGGCPQDTLFVSNPLGGTMCQPITDYFDSVSCTSGTLKGWFNGAPVCVTPGVTLPPTSDISGAPPGNPTLGKCKNTFASYCDSQCDAAGYDTGVKSSCSLWAQTVGCRCSNPRNTRPSANISLKAVEDCGDLDQATLCMSRCQVLSYTNGVPNSCTALADPLFKATLTCTCSD